MPRCQKQPNKFTNRHPQSDKNTSSKAFNQPANLTNNQAQVPPVRLINPIYPVIRVDQSEASIVSALTNERRGEAQDTGTRPSPVCPNHKHLSLDWIISFLFQFQSKYFCEYLALSICDSYLAI